MAFSSFFDGDWLDRLFRGVLWFMIFLMLFFAMPVGKITLSAKEIVVKKWYRRIKTHPVSDITTLTLIYKEIPSRFFLRKQQNHYFELRGSLSNGKQFIYSLVPRDVGTLMAILSEMTCPVNYDPSCYTYLNKDKNLRDMGEFMEETQLKIAPYLLVVILIITILNVIFTFTKTS